MTKEEMFDHLWVIREWCQMGYDYDALYRSMTKRQVERRYKEAKNDKCSCV